jgi:hypothetical protein
MADGNCFFRVLAKNGAGGRPESSDADYAALRAAVSAHALTHRDVFQEPFSLQVANNNPDDMQLSYDEFVHTVLRVDKKPSDNFDIVVASHYLRRPIVVHQENNPSHTVEWPGRVDGGAPIHVLFQPPFQVVDTEIGHYQFVYDGQQQ